MGNKFDRALQKEILHVSVAAYQRHTMWENFEPSLIGTDDLTLSANIIYLAEQSLISIKNRTNDDPYSFFDNMSATDEGVDFLQNDGGFFCIFKYSYNKVSQRGRCFA